MCIITKFKKEHISDEWTRKAILSFRNEIDKLAELIAKNDMLEVHSYIESL